MPVRQRSVAMVYQQFVNYPTLTVFENIASPLRVAGCRKAEIEARVEQAARLLRLENLLDRLPAQLSGGQQQRTAIARALVKRAELVLLDEPLANLDYKLREELREELPRSSPSPARSWSMRRPSRPRRCCSAAPRRRMWRRRASRRSGRRPRSIAGPHNIDAARVFSDPPLNEFAVEKRGALRAARQGGRQLPAPAPLAGLADGAYRLGFRAEDARARRRGPGRAAAFPARSR